MGQVSTPVEIIPNAVDEGGPADAAASRLTYSLSANRPNPFAAATTIRYSLADRVDVNVGVYDIKGRLIRTLVSGAQDAGSYTVAWNGRDDGGHALGAGIYFVHYRAAGHEFRRKATLLR